MKQVLQHLAAEYARHPIETALAVLGAIAVPAYVIAVAVAP